MLPLLDLPYSTVVDVLKKADFVTLTRLRKTCSTLDEFAEKNRHLCSRNQADFDLRIRYDVVDKKINCELSCPWKYLETRNPVKQLSGLGVKRIIIDFDFSPYYQHDACELFFHQALEITKKLKMFPQILQTIFLPQFLAIEIATFLEISQLRLHSQSNSFLEVISDPNLKKFPNLELRMNYQLDDFPENSLDYIRNFEIFDLSYFHKETVYRLLTNFSTAQNFGNLKYVNIHTKWITELKDCISSEAIRTLWKKTIEPMDNCSILEPIAIYLMETLTHNILISEGEEIFSDQTTFVIMPLPKSHGLKEFDAMNPVTPDWVFGKETDFTKHVKVAFRDFKFSEME